MELTITPNQTARKRIAAPNRKRLASVPVSSEDVAVLI